MKISVITPAYNAAKFIEEVICSVSNQTYKNVEHIIVDGGSTDGTTLILEKHPYLKWVSEPDKGIYDAMNKGIAMATGNWIIFLGADDTFFSEKTLSLLTTEYEEQLDSNDIVYGNVVFSEWSTMSHSHKIFSKYDFHKANINHQAIFYRSSIFEKVGLYSLQYPVFADWEFNIRCFFTEKIRTEYIPLIISNFSVEGISNQRKDVFYENKSFYFNELIAKKGWKEKILFNLYKTPRKQILKKTILKLIVKILT